MLPWGFATERSMSSAVWKAVGVAVFVPVIVALASWPLAWNLEDYIWARTYSDDSGCALWQPWNVLRQLRAGANPFFAPEMYHPHGMDTTLHLWNLGVALLRMPFFVVADPMRALALANLTLGLLNGLGGYVLGRVVGGRYSAGLAAAALAASSSYVWTEIGQGGRGEQGLLLFLMLALAGLFALLRGSGHRVAVATGVACAATAACYWYYGYFLALAAALIVGWALIRRRLDRAMGGRLLAAGGVALLLALPAALPVLLEISAQDSTYLRTMDAVDLHGSPIEGLSLRSLGWPLSGETAWSRHPRTSLLLKLLLVLGILVPAIRRRSQWLAGLGIVALVLALGPVLHVASGQPALVGDRLIAMPHALVSELPGMGRFWWATRWLALSQVAAVGVVAGVAAALRHPRSRVALVVAVAVLGVLECQAINEFARQGKHTQTGCPIPLVVEMLGQQPDPHPVVQLPLHNMGHLKWLPYHQQPIDGGLGDGRSILMPDEYARLLEEEPVMAALSEVSREQPVTVVPVDPEQELCVLGFHYLLYWKTEGQYSRIERSLHKLMLRPPDHQESLVQTWRLRPCARDAPLPTENTREGPAMPGRAGLTP
jgi:hypothetical protein